MKSKGGSCILNLLFFLLIAALGRLPRAPLAFGLGVRPGDRDFPGVFLGDEGALLGDAGAGLEGALLGDKGAGFAGAFLGGEGAGFAGAFFGMLLGGIFF